MRLVRLAKQWRANHVDGSVKRVDLYQPSMRAKPARRPKDGCDEKDDLDDAGNDRRDAAKAGY
jgi:hypothetical protein